ncbi:polyamine ABC transporter substrate-binding protein [Azospirillum halopraeferens]|uniref:polyamine ABC transporter substrate-binding protein n=1 Tax=Azospirillum halopraeferens TaxID=34010 RepID=UPI0004287422|nr:polyamine ABC transporter substrate-binding protein [Azospirillum halopraeferens]
MTKRIALGVLGAAVAAALAGGAVAQTKRPVNIYIWNDYLGETTLADFTAASGYPTNVDLYDSLELLEQKVLVGRSGYDVIVPTVQPTGARMIQANILAPLDKDKLPNLKNVDPKVLKQLESADPGNRFLVPYLGGTVGIGILPDKIKALMPDAPLDSWDLIFKPEVAQKLAPCGITLMDSAIDVIPTALHYLGLDPNSEKKEDHDKAEALLTSIRPYVKQFVTGQNINLLAGGDACVVMAYSGDVLQAESRAEEAKSGVTVEYVIPKEGAQVWWDVLAIPADAPNKDGAHALIDFVLQPEAMVGITNFVMYGNAVPATLASLEDAVKNNPAIFPREDQKERLFSLVAVKPPVERMRTRLWTKVKTGQ